MWTDVHTHMVFFPTSLHAFFVLEALHVPVGHFPFILASPNSTVHVPTLGGISTTLVLRSVVHHDYIIHVHIACYS